MDLPPAGVSLLCAIIHKIHVHRTLKFQEVDVTIQSLYESYGLWIDSHAKIHSPILHTIGKLLSQKGYAVRLFSSIDPREEKHHNEVLYTVIWSEDLSQEFFGNDCVEFKTDARLEDLSLVHMPPKI